MQRHTDEPLRVLIVSATVGAGDAGNARELARRLTVAGHRPFVKDFLEAAPFRIGKGLSKGYEAELRHAPWAYELVFDVWYWFPFLLGPLARLLTLFTRKAIVRWACETRADVVVSTYPVATQVLGQLRREAHRRLPVRRKRALHVPVVNFITDFGYHPFWAHRWVDLNLAVHPSTVAAVATRTGRPSACCAPLVRPQFARAAAARSAQRERLGLRDDEVAVLISSGSWGLGTVRETFERLATQGAPGAKLVPVVVCGRNSALLGNLRSLAAAKGYRSIVLGWTADMPGLMAAADVLVENAGGLTCMEALASGLPVVSFQPIPGHGRKSAEVMAAAGISRYARDGAQLAGYARELALPGRARARQLRAAAGLFTADAAALVAQLGIWGAPPLPPLRPAARAVRVGSTAALVVAASWVGMTTGVGVAAAAGAGVAHPPSGQVDTVYLGVRLTEAELADQGVQLELLRLHASAVVDASTAKADPASVRRLTKLGIDLQSGGLGLTPGAAGAPLAPWSIASCDSQSVGLLSAIAGTTVTALVPDRSISAFDLVDASSDHLKMIVPNVTLPLPPGGPFPQSSLALPVLQGRDVYVVDGRKVTASQLTVLLGDLGSELAGEGLSSRSLSGLQ
ncbi:MAG TPA: hypothetical protein VL984_07960 [Acidimicrobiales bacterium]|nr:hypothetical protein [Acidimicrobiales bacterium]